MEDVMNNDAKYYFEAHVTIEPVFDQRLEYAAAIAREYKFKIADLLMKKRNEDTAQRSQYDTFMTGHSKHYDDIQNRIYKLVTTLKSKGFKVWRYKIEDTLMDSKLNDELEVL